MANHASAEKSIRQRKKVTAQNRAQTSTMRGACRKAREALGTANLETVDAAFGTMQSTLMKAARKNKIHKNKMSRLISRAAKKLKAITQ